MPALTVFSLLLLFALAAAWFLELRWDRPWSAQSDGSLDQEYTRALAQGHAYLLTPPDPRVLAAPDPLRSPYHLMDASLYHGRYYLYFGALPFVLLLVPWFLATGTYFPATAAIFLFSLAGYVAYARLLLVLSRRWPGRGASLVAGLVFCGFVACSGTWPLMAEPQIYEIENAAAYACIAWALCAVASVECSQGGRGALARAAGFAGLALACRPNYLPAAAVIAGYILWRGRRPDAAPWPARTARSLAPLLPLAIILAALAVWNTVRFGSPLDFGATQPGHEQGAKVLVSMSVRNVPYNLYQYLWGGAWLGSYFPFIQGPKVNPIALARNQVSSDWLIGFLLTSPLVLWGLLVPFQWRVLRREGLAVLGAVLALAGAGNLLFLCLVRGGTFRYPADFLGLFAALAGLGVLAFNPCATARKRWLALPLLGLTVGWSLLGTTAVTCSIAQIRRHYDATGLSELSRLGRVLDAAVFRIEEILHDGPRGIRLDLRLPAEKYGSAEPLVVSGRPAEQDLLYAYYAGPGVIQFGFESMGHGGPVTGPIAVDYRAPHRLEVFFGSFLPPDGSPLVRPLSPDEARPRPPHHSRLAGRRRGHGERRAVSLRGGQLFIGASPDNGAFGGRFSGEILAVSHPPLRDSLPSRVDRRDVLDPPRSRWIFGLNPEHIVDPIVSIGNRPTGGVLGLEFLGTGRVRWVWTRFGQTPVVSPAWAWDYGRAALGGGLVRRAAAARRKPALAAGGSRRHRGAQGRDCLPGRWENGLRIPGRSPRCVAPGNFLRAKHGQHPGSCRRAPGGLTVSRQAW